jgi:signal transduction histidine kinase
VDIHTAVDDALRILYNSYKLLPIHIERRYARDLPRVEGNFANLGQVFVNIVKNALDALPGEGGAITITTATDGDREGNRVSVSFRDTGQGIPDAGWWTSQALLHHQRGRTGERVSGSTFPQIIRRQGGRSSSAAKRGGGREVTVLLPARRMP